ncbi:MFS transporter [Thioclava sp. GXIMD2076]|uniref:MFS transporter n=1 Tax=Thioclava sp. GXIMD2076 TaxID=3131931 RepID=UPI0030D46C3E
MSSPSPVSGAAAGKLGPAACMLAMFSALLGSTAPSPLYPFYIAHLDLPQVMGTAIFATYAVGTLCALFLAGAIGSGIRDLRFVLWPGLLITALGAAIFSHPDSLWTLLTGRFLNGFGTGLITGTASTALFELSHPDKRGRAAMFATLAFTLGAAGGPLLTATCLELGLAATSLPFVIIVGLAVLAMVGLKLAAWPPREPRTGAGAKAASGASQGGQLGLYLLACLGLTVAWMLGSLLMAIGTDLGQRAYAIRSVGLAGMVPALFQLFGGVGQVFWGRSLPLRTLIIGMIGLALAQSILLLALPGEHGWIMLAMMPVCGFFYGAAFVSALGIATQAAPPETRANWISRFYVVGYLSNAVPTVVMGGLIDLIGLSPAFFWFGLVVIGLACLGAALALQSRRAALAV